VSAAALGAGPSQAADLGQYSYKDRPAPSWRGFYFGLDAGGLAQGESAVFFVSPEAPGPNQTNKVDMKGAAGGFHLGYNAQFGVIVAGIEGDANYAQTDTLTQATYLGGVAESQVAGLYSARGRLGVALRPDLLAYGTGGIALAGMDHSLDFGGENFHKDGSTVTGAVYGGGFEYLYAPGTTRLSFGLEVLHYDFGSDRFTLNNMAGNTIPIDVETNFTTVRGRISLHLD
jgi:outer membrane immunogenic protein